jgi:RNase H-like domain found in reverse transcriptase
MGAQKRYKFVHHCELLACGTNLSMMDMRNLVVSDLWVITDGSKSGIGAVYGQGREWQTCRPAGFLSKKFSVAQQHYRTHEHETIAVLEALMKWEDKLLGRKFTLVTDHKGLEYFETQKNLSDRQVQWWEFLSRFNFTIMLVDGVANKVADCPSPYYENDTGDESHLEHIYVNADVILDPDGELCPPTGIWS